MSPTDYRDDILPQDTQDDDSSFDSNADNPVSETELRDLLYSGDHSPEERLRLLRELRNNVGEREAADFGDNDPGALRSEIDERIGELEDDDETGTVTMDVDPLAHRETLAPDSDELEELEEDDEASVEGEDEGDLDNDDDVAG